MNRTFPPGKQVLKDISLSFFEGAKIGIVGLNGSGKSSLLKIIAGLDKEFSGELTFRPNLTIGYLEQEPKLNPNKTVKENVMEGCGEAATLLADFEAVSAKLGEDISPEEMEKLIDQQAALQDKIDAIERADDRHGRPGGDTTLWEGAIDKAGDTIAEVREAIEMARDSNAGGTGTHPVTAGLPGVTEIQAGGAGGMGLKGLWALVGNSTAMVLLSVVMFIMIRQVQAMHRGHDAGLGKRGEHVGVDAALGGRIERCRRFVEDQYISAL